MAQIVSESRLDADGSFWFAAACTDGTGILAVYLPASLVPVEPEIEEIVKGMENKRGCSPVCYGGSPFFLR